MYGRNNTKSKWFKSGAFDRASWAPAVSGRGAVERRRRPPIEDRTPCRSIGREGQIWGTGSRWSCPANSLRWPQAPHL